MTKSNQIRGQRLNKNVTEHSGTSAFAIISCIVLIRLKRACGTFIVYSFILYIFNLIILMNEDRHC